MATASGRRPAAPRAEEELLLWCARPVRDAESLARAGQLAGEIADWEELGRLAWSHGVIPLLVRGLAALPPGTVPPEALARLRMRYLERAQRAMVMTGELLGILAALEEAGIAAIPYKGPVLAAQAHGNVSLRHFRDLDILVTPDAVDRAEAVLAARGYRHATPPTAPERRLLRKVGCEYELVRDDGIMVELHWRLFGHYLALPLDLGALRARLVPVALGGREVRTFALEDLLLILCAHGGDHSWERLEWLADVAALVARHPELDWETLIARARQAGALRLVWLGLWLASDLLGAPVPGQVLAQVRADRRVGLIAADVRAALFDEALAIRRSERPVYIFNLAMRERRRDRIHYWLSRGFMPTTEDVAFVALPGRLLPLYYLLRPLRLIGLFCLRLARRARAAGRQSALSGP
jgi:hypothetical protein